MRVIVTGGAGFIGSALVRHLVLEKGFEVLNIDALTYAGNRASLHSVEDKPNHRFLKANICDRSATIPFLRSVATGQEGEIDQAILDDVITTAPRSVTP